MAEQVFHYRGAHSLQFGGQVQRIQHNDHYTPSQTRGSFQFADLTSFLQGNATMFTGLAAGANDPTKALRQIYVSGFVQDDYKILPNLTLNLGFRYELLTVPVEASGNRISNYRRQLINGFVTVDSLPTVGSPFFQGNHDTFAPRIGFAWIPFGDGNLALRGGFGIFYDQVDSDYRFYTPNNSPFVTSRSVANPPFPYGFSATAGNPPLPAPDSIDFNLKVPTRVQYSFNIQRQFGSSSVLNGMVISGHIWSFSQLG